MVNDWNVVGSQPDIEFYGICTKFNGSLKSGQRVFGFLRCNSPMCNDFKISHWLQRQQQSHSKLTRPLVMAEATQLYSQPQRHPTVVGVRPPQFVCGEAAGTPSGPPRSISHGYTMRASVIAA